MTEFVRIDQLGINSCQLDVLTPDHMMSKIMMLQCHGEIDTSNGAKLASQDSTEKLTKFFELSNQVNPSLLITPECSCTWEAIKILIDSNNRPNKGALWIIGCENIEFSEYIEIKKESEDKVLWIDHLPPQTNDKKYLNSVIYLFHIYDNEDENTTKICALVQFKNHQMGGTTFEIENLITGNIVYVLHNDNDDSIRLITYICSDTLEFDLNKLESDKYYLLIHIQLIDDPFHCEISNYRKELYRRNGHLYEVLSLNWAKESSVNGQSINNYNGGSAYYLHPQNKEKEPCVDKDRIIANHKKGMYLHFCNHYKYSSYFFSANESVLIFNTTKVSQSRALDVNKNRFGLIALESFNWSHNKWEMVDDAEFVDDKVKDHFQDAYGKEEPNILKRELLLSMSTGRISSEHLDDSMLKDIPPSQKQSLYKYIWFKPKNIKSFILADNGTPNGTLTVLNDQQEEQLSESISRFKKVVNIFSNDSNIPEELDDFKGKNLKLMISDDEYNSKCIQNNVFSEFGSFALVHLGDQTKERALKMKSEILAVLEPERFLIIYYDGDTREYFVSEIGNIMSAKHSLERII